MWGFKRDSLKTRQWGQACLWFALVCASTLFVLLSSTGKAKTVEDLAALAARVKAAENLSFQGKQIIIRFLPGPEDPSLTPLAFTREVFQQGRGRLRWEENNEEQRGLVVVGDGTYLWQGYPGFNYVLREPLTAETLGRAGFWAVVTPPSLVQDLRPEERPTLTTAGEMEICGRQTVLCELVLRGEAKRYKAWIDPDSGLILREERFNARGELTYLMFYTTLNLNPHFSPDTFQYRLEPGQTILTDAGLWRRRLLAWKLEPELQAPLPWPEYLPPGYRFEGASLLPPEEGPKTVHLRFSRGEELLSLFILPDRHRPRSQPLQRFIYLQRGGIGIIRWQNEKINLILIGREDRQILLKIAESVSWTSGR